MNQPSFQFDGYTLRPATEADRPILEQWIEADPFHRGRVLPDFFLRTIPGEDSWALENASGYVVFYFKTQTATRIHIQFSPAETDEARDRNREAMTKGLKWLEGVLAGNNFREILFESQNPLLRVLAQNKLGFTASRGELVRIIPAPSLQK